MKNSYKTLKKQLAIKKLKDLFNKVIISNVYREGKEYVINWISPKEFYRNSLESQIDMKKYLDFLLNKFEPSDKELEDEQKDKIYNDLSKKINK